MSNYFRTMKKMLATNADISSDAQEVSDYDEVFINKKEIITEDNEQPLVIEQPPITDSTYCSAHLGAQGIYGQYGYKSTKPFYELFRPNQDDNNGYNVDWANYIHNKNQDGHYHYRWNYRYTDVVDTKLGNRTSILIDFDKELSLS